MDTLNKINELTEQLVLDGKKFFDGNKSAGTRTRKTDLPRANRSGIITQY